jgi:hypothetical protein
MAPRPGKETGHVSCPNGCTGEEFKVEPTGRLERGVLFPWQQGRGGPGGKNGSVFKADKHGHDEAEVRCLCCSTTFMTISPVMVRDALVLRGEAAPEEA